MPNGDNIWGRAPHSDSVSITHFRIRRTGLLVWLAVAACWIAWPHSLAAAGIEEACTILTNELEKGGKQAPEKPEQTDRNTTIRSAIKDLVTKLTPFQTEISNKKLAGGNLAWVTFEGKKIVDFQATNPDKICVRAYVLAGSKPDVTIQQVAPFDKDPVKGLKVVFKVDTPSIHWYWPWADVDYAVVGVLADTTPTFFSYLTTVTVADPWETLILSGLFVLMAYIFLAWTTYPDKGDAKKAGEPADASKPDDAKKPDDNLQALTGGKWLLFALSPVRISAAWFGEASMSQLQVLIFTFVVAGLMLNLFLRTGTLSELSMDLLKLIGISAVGSATAKFTQTLKTGLKAETASFLIGKGWYQWDLRAIQNTATLRQLLLTDNRLDVYKFQMLIFTVIVALYVMSAGQTGLGEVKISETMLYLIGISQVVYVGGKAVTDRTTDLENAVAKMRELESKLKDAKPKALTNEQKEWLVQYQEAAETAAEEFAFLQNRIYPRATPSDPHSKPAPEILVPSQSFVAAS
jgi:hypothetical protein